MCKKTLDHLGNEFISEIEMCKHYGINKGTYRNRIRNGWSKEDALSKEARNITYAPVFVDHLGNTYKNQQTMCEHYKIEQDVFFRRKEHGWSLEDALTKPVREKNNDPILIDHLGNVFLSQSKMCEHYKIDISTFRWRISKGMSLEDALTTPVKKDEEYIMTDHLGNIFPTQIKMCEHYKINYNVFRYRISKGMSLKDALTTPVKEQNNNPVLIDHLGNAFSTQTKMCEHYGITCDMFRYRISKGMSLKDALTTPIKRGDQNNNY